MAYSNPLMHLEIRAGDQALLYYPKERLIKSCHTIQDLHNENNQITMIELPFSEKAITTFLNFIETRTVLLENITDLARVADYVDLVYLNPQLPSRSEIVEYLFNQLPNGETQKKFLQAQKIDPTEWYAFIYLETHSEEFETWAASLALSECEHIFWLTDRHVQCGYDTNPGQTLCDCCLARESLLKNRAQFGPCKGSSRRTR
jgi:hypothetical protein